MKKRFTSTFKAQVVHELLKGDKTLSQISSEYGVAATQLSQWKSTALKGLPSLFEDDHKAVERVKADYEHRIEELYGEIYASPLRQDTKSAKIRYNLEQPFVSKLPA